MISLLLVVFGLVAFTRLPLREYPDIDPPVVSIETNYTGAAANVVETRITELIEDSIAGIEGIKTIASSSIDGRSQITVEFNINRDVDGAANDIRDRISAIIDDLPDEADPPEIQKVDADADVIMWLNLVSDQMSHMMTSASASTFWISGGSASSGRSSRTAEMRSRISLAAPSTSRSMLNSTVIRERPSMLDDAMVLMPSTPAMLSSINSVMRVSTTLAAAPV